MNRRSAGAVGATALAVATIAVWSVNQDNPPEFGTSEGSVPDAAQIVEVQQVSDGDTIRVKVDGDSLRVRLIGVDAPEVHTSRDCGGPESSQHLSSLVHRGDRVRLISDGSQDEQDQYDRILAYVHTTDGTDVGEAQIAAGWAEVYRHGRRFERHNTYQRAETQARHQNVGIWSQC